MILLQNHKHMSWKTEDITHCQLMCDNLLPLYLSFILLLHPVCYILNCYFVVGQETWQLMFTV